VIFFISAILAFAILGLLVFLLLFEPGLEYGVEAPRYPLESNEYLRLLSALADAQVHDQSKVSVLTGGDQYWPDELDAIRSAKHCITIEAYILYEGEISRQILDALTERARAGVKVKMVIDSIGSFSTHDAYFDELRKAGGRVEWYQPVTWWNFKRFNNRTHREIIVIDGKVGFTGGSGIADVWFNGKDKKGNQTPRWRDTMVRVEGDLVMGLQTAFAENWLESSGEILVGGDYFPTGDIEQEDVPEHSSAGLCVVSAPQAGRSTRARILFQVLMASAKKEILITSPYFLPDRSARKEMLKAVQRGVSVRVITPGDHADHLLTRRSSRARYGDLLRGGVRIAEYQPAMIHAKIMLVDGIWSVVGSTNFDNRSFGINDEINLAVRDPQLAARLEEDFARDWAQSKPVTLEAWERRPASERVVELLGKVIERQQ
jgi:cardiolipin synthase